MRKFEDVATHALLVILSLLFLLPFYILVRNALMTDPQMTGFDWIWFPPEPQWRNFVDLFADQLVPMANSFKNSAMIAISIAVCEILIAIMAGYALARIPHPGRNLIFGLLLSTLLIPGTGTLIPKYVMVAKMGMVNTPQGLVLPQMFSVFSAFMFRQYFLSFPRDLEDAVDQDVITRAAVAEVIAHGETRRSWLAFCSGVRHATHVAEEFRRRGVSCATIFGKTPKDERDAIIAAFKRGEIRALASMGVLTTGFNAPAVDLIAMLRPTKSAGLYVQMAGRGTRLAEGKENCLVLDFAGNVRRHGPIDLVRPKRPGGPGDGPPPTKICPKCGTIVAIAALECPDCGFEFPGREVKLEPTASTLEVLSTGKPQWVGVTDVTYSRHEKHGGRVSLKVTYRCGLAFHTEWVCFEHEGYPRRKAASWWRERAPELDVPESVDEALILADQLRRPTEIAVRPAGRFTEITAYRFAPCLSSVPGSAPSATENPAAGAGSTRASASPTRGATRAAETSAAGFARTSATGGRA